MNRLLIGETLLNQFRVENFIAAGGMATIYRVWDLQRGVPLAMKVLKSELASDPAFMARFTHEARALEALSHPHIVPFYSMYQAEDLTFLLEQYIDGPSLDEVLHRMKGAPVGLRDALVYFKALYTSLGYAHAQGIIHCDVKPGNVLIDQGGRVFLTDFGIARYAEAASSTTSIGTPVYMAPEQIRGERVSPQTDIYSLGALMFELLTGRRPFRPDGNYPPEAGTDQADQLRYAHLYLPPPDPRELNPALSPALAQMILKAMAKDPAERFASMQAMAEATFSAVNTRYEALPDRVTLPGGLWAEVHRSQAEGTGTLTPPHGATPPGEAALAERDNIDAQRAASSQPVRVGRFFPRQVIVLLSLLFVVSLCAFAGSRLAMAFSSTANRASSLHPPLPPNLPIFPSRTPLPGETLIPAQITNSGGSAQKTPGATPVQAPTPTGAALPHPGALTAGVKGEIALVEKQAGKDRLFLYQLDSKQTTPIEVHPEADWAWAPQWSPDGKSLTWVSQYSGSSHILVQDQENGDWQQIDAGQGYNSVFSPSWRGKENQIAFWAAKGGKNYVVFADAQSGQQVDLIELPAYRNLFVWNWQSGQVAYAAQDDKNRNLVVIAASPLQADTPILTGSESYAPAWSRDGQWLAFQGTGAAGSGASEIFICKPDGSQLRQVTFGPASTWSRAPTWSPDGKYIGFVSNQAGSTGDDYGELFIVEVATGKVKQITDTGGAVYDWRADWRP